MMMRREAKSSSRAAASARPFLMLITTLQIMISWVVFTTGRAPLPLPTHHLGRRQADRGTQLHSNINNWVEETRGAAGGSPMCSKIKGSSMMDHQQMGPAAAGAAAEELRAGNAVVGSTPPSCHNRCGGCLPCAAIQVPTTADRVAGVQQYTNYVPEGWKCKCGSSFYNP